MTRLQNIRRILLWVLLLNVLVASAKWIYGVITQSLGMQADGLHSFFDGLSNIVGLLGLWLASPKPDADHPYGHKKFETLATGAIGGLLAMTCLYLIWKAYRSWTMDIHPQVTTISFTIMFITMSMNIFVTKWERQKGKEFKSDILMADSYHTASDVLTSLSVVAGLIAIQAGYPSIDPLVAIIIAGIIAWTAMIVLRDVLSSLTDQIRIDPQDIHSAVISLPGILDCHNIRTRGLANHVFVDLSIHVEPTWSVEQAHKLATTVETMLIDHFDSVEDVVVHVEPEGHEPEA